MGFASSAASFGPAIALVLLRKEVLAKLGPKSPSQSGFSGSLQPEMVVKNVVAKKSKAHNHQ